MKNASFLLMSLAVSHGAKSHGVIVAVSSATGDTITFV